jgi:hypothetical protein
MHARHVSAIGRCAVVAGLTFSCTGDTAPLPSPTPRPISGALVSVTTTQTETSLVRYRAADAAADSLPAPIDPEAVNRSTVVGTATVDGTLFVSANARELQVFSLPSGSGEVTPVGPPLDVAGEEEPAIGVTEAGAVVATCDRVEVLPLPSADRWISLGRGCWAALAPGGDRIAISPDGRQVEERSLSGADATVLFRVDQLRKTMGTEEVPELIGTPTWGPPGIAFLVRAGNQLAAFVHEQESGEIVEILQEEYANEFRVPELAWQPRGSLLAMTDDVSSNRGVVRIFDPDSGELRAISLDPVGYAGMQWAPDGSSLAVLTGTRVLLVLDMNGAWLLRRETDWRELLGWSSM